MVIGYSAISVIFSIIYPKVKKNWAYICTCIALVVAFLLLVYNRPLFFRDTLAYIRSYDAAKWEYIKNIDIFGKEAHTQMEYGYVLIMLIFKSMGLPFRFLSAIITLFNIITCFYASKFYCELLTGDNIGSNHSFTSFWAIFLVHFGLLYSFVVIRGGFTYSLLMIAACFVLRAKYVPAAVLFVIAFSIQRLSIIGIVPIIAFTLYKKIRLSKKTFLVCYVVIFVIWLIESSSHILINTVGALLAQWYNSIISTNIYALTSRSFGITDTIFMIGYFINGIVYYVEYKKTHMYMTLSLIYLMSIGAVAVLCGNSTFYRMSDYLYIYSIPMNYYCLMNWKKSTALRAIYFGLLLMSFLLLWGKNFLFWYLYD